MIRKQTFFRMAAIRFKRLFVGQANLQILPPFLRQNRKLQPVKNLLYNIFGWIQAHYNEY